MLKKYLRETYQFGLLALQKDKARLKKIKRENLLTILNLHRVSPDDNPFWSPLHPQMFEELLKFLQANFQVCLFDEIKEKSASSEKPLAILSFDDGYSDFLEYAAPLLEKYEMRVNMNVIPQCVESGEPIWNIQLYDFLGSAPLKFINELNISGFTGKLKDESDEAKLKFGMQIDFYLKKRPQKERAEFWSEIKPFLEKSDFERTKMMTRGQIAEIAGTHEIGAHSFSHESMGFESNEFFAADFRRCRDYFENSLRMPLEIYAFPNGSYRDEQVEILKAERVKHILLVDEQFSAFPNDDVYKRFTFYGRTKTEVKLKALGF